MKLKKQQIEIGLNTFYQLLARAVSAIVALIITRFLASTIGLNGYGEYQIVVTYVSFFWVFTDLGLTTIAVREVGKDLSRLEVYFSNLLSLRLLSGIVLTLISLIIVLFLPYSEKLKTAILFASLTILIQSIFGAGMVVIQQKSKYFYFFVANLISGLVLLLGTFLFALQGGSVIGLTVALLLSNFVLIAVQLIFVGREVSLGLTLTKLLVKDLLKKGLPYGVSLIFNTTVYKQDALLLSILPLASISNTNAVGIYNLAYKIFEIGIIVPGYLLNVLFPQLNMQYQEKNYSQFKRSFSRTIVLLTLWGFIGSFLLLICAPILVQLVSGNNQFAHATTVLKILALAVPASFVLPLLVHYQIIIEKQVRLAYIFGLGWFLNLFFNLIFIPKGTYYAAAITTVITEWVFLIGLIFFSFHHVSKLRNES